MKKINQGLVVVSLIVIFHIPFPSYANEVPNEVLSAAQEGIQIFVKNLQPPRFGFLSQEDIDDATIGQGFQLFTIIPVNLLNTIETPRDLSSLLVSTNIWQFFITTRGKAVAMITVDFINNKWTPVSIGSSVLSSELSKLIETWPTSSGYHYRLIRVYQANSEFMELSTRGGIIGIISLGTARRALGLTKREFDPFDIHNFADIVKQITPIVRRNVELQNSH